jgi:hypothetical protein
MYRQNYVFREFCKYITERALKAEDAYHRWECAYYQLGALLSSSCDFNASRLNHFNDEYTVIEINNILKKEIDDINDHDKEILKSSINYFEENILHYE